MPFALLFALASAAAGADPCTEPPLIRSGVAALHGEVVEAEDFTSAEIRRGADHLAPARSNTSRTHHACKAMSSTTNTRTSRSAACSLC